MKNEPQKEIIIPKWELIKDIILSYKQTRRNFWWLFLLLLLNILFIISEPYFYKHFIDNIQQFLSNSINFEEIKRNSIFLIFIWIVISISWVVAWFFYEIIILNIMHKDWKQFILKMWRNFVYLPYEEFVNSNPGKQQSIFQKWEDAFWYIWRHFMVSILSQSLIFISLFAYWFYINWRMTLVSLIFLPFSIMTSFFVWTKAYNMQKENNILWNKSFQRFNDALNNIWIIKIFAKEKQEYTVFDSYFSDTIKWQARVNLYRSLLSALLKWIQIFWRISVLWFWVFFVIKWYLTIWELLVFIFISWRITWPIESLLQSYQVITTRLADYYKAKQIINSQKEIDNWTQEFVWIKNSIEFKNINFNYSKSNREILKNVNITINKWQKIALVGHTWSWKTTISNLINRFYLPSSWEVLIDWININEFTLESYRWKMAAVFQDTTVFNDTIFNNLQYINMDASIDDIREACKQAEILTFIDSLEKWFETEVGEKWLKLSWWERQRLAIARAILRNPDILILDEPTSALDSKTERGIQKSLNRLMKWRTSIIIAHRLSTIKHADVIFVIDKWKIIASGKHDELYESCPQYKEMVDYQRDWAIGD